MITLTGSLSAPAPAMGRAAPLPPAAGAVGRPSFRSAQPPRRPESIDERTRGVGGEVKKEDAFDLDEDDELSAAMPQLEAPGAAPEQEGETPAAPEEKPAKKRAGLFQRAMYAIFGGKQPLRGRVVSRKDTTIVIDIEVLEAMDWDDAALARGAVHVRLADGTEISATVDTSKTTRAAHLVPGQHAKLVLVLDEEPVGPLKIVFFVELGLEIPLA
jgi:hypothetical protein